MIVSITTGQNPTMSVIHKIDRSHILPRTHYNFIQRMLTKPDGIHTTKDLSNQLYLMRHSGHVDWIGKDDNGHSMWRPTTKGIVASYNVPLHDVPDYLLEGETINNRWVRSKSTTITLALPHPILPNRFLPSLLMAWRNADPVARVFDVRTSVPIMPTQPTRLFPDLPSK